MPKIGMIWLYIKRSIQDLLRIAAETESTRSKETLAPDFAQSLSDELDSVFQERRPLSDGSLDQAEMKGLVRPATRAQREWDERKT